MKKKVQMIGSGFIVGCFSGLLGVGGGVFMVPIMVGWLGFTQHLAQGTSLAMIIPTALFSSIVYGLHGQIDVHIALELAAGSIFGAALGARIMTHLPAARLKQLFGLLLVVVGIRMVLL